MCSSNTRPLMPVCVRTFQAAKMSVFMANSRAKLFAVCLDQGIRKVRFPCCHNAIIPSSKTHPRAFSCGQPEDFAFVITFSWADIRAGGHSQLAEQVGMAHMPGVGRRA